MHSGGRWGSWRGLFWVGCWNDGSDQDDVCSMGRPRQRGAVQIRDLIVVEVCLAFMNNVLESVFTLLPLPADDL